MSITSSNLLTEDNQFLLLRELKSDLLGRYEIHFLESIVVLHLCNVEVECCKNMAKCPLVLVLVQSVASGTGTTVSHEGA